MTRRLLLFRFLVVALPLLAVLGLLHQYDLARERELWQRRMGDSVGQSVASLTAGFHEVAADTLALAADAEFRTELLRNDFSCLTSRFESLARFKPHYRQVRYIDETGMEKLRVDATSRGVTRTAPADLQNKSGRDYFREAAELDDLSVRLSRLDLNIEHGRIEEPHNPMLRFSSPVFDAAGRRRGVIVINLGVAPLLDKLERDISGGGRLMLVNARGSSLAGGEPALRWGDVLGNGNGFARERPQAWQRLTGEGDGAPTEWIVDDWMYARAMLRPVDIVRGNLANTDVRVSSADPWWAVVAEAGLAEVDSQPSARLRIGLAVASGGLALWLFTLFGWQRLKRAAHAAEQRIRQLARVVEQTSDIVFITDPDGRIEYVNPAFTVTTGYAREEAEGQTPALIKSGQHSPSFIAGLWQEIKTGRQFRDLFVNRRRDGTLFYEEKTISPMLDDSGRISSFVSTGKDVTDSKLTRLAFHDQLTGLINRTLFLDRLRHEMAHAARSGQIMAVLYMDLDGFKAINDDAGHRVGDEILKEFAARIGLLMRKSDTFARLGGDEFAILLRDIGNAAGAEQVADKIVDAMRTDWQMNGRTFALGVSIGIALYPAEDVDSDSLLARADAAMYAAKRGGRNRCALYGADTVA